MERNALHLCANCLAGGANGFPIGNDKGTQRDPYRETIPLCRDCAAALSSGDLATFSARYRDSRSIRRGGTDDTYSYKEGDSAGGYWSHLLVNGTPVGTILEPDLVGRIVALLNREER